MRNEAKEYGNLREKFHDFQTYVSAIVCLDSINANDVDRDFPNQVEKAI